MRLASLVMPFALVMLLQPSHAADNENKLPDEVRAILDKADEIELISLDPKRLKDPKDGFHGYKVLGQATVRKDDKNTAVAAISKGIKESVLGGALCFSPRHGIKATHDKKTVELVICFECEHVHVYMGGELVDRLHTTADPQKAFDKLLTDAKVPLPGKPEKK